ncbi:GlsB/YeaQ/YmgE family stress response membrane protein [Sphingomonas sp. ASV193]|uniref:GlsB/YeaQ/YmgE family stress response membrane protein n=1 Tax=Sphingomonas sp. ASV193 TaxID=3144405 RepID=UPI0032E8ACA5
MHFVVMIVVGLIVGLLARFIYPGAVHMTILGTIVLGILGSLIAGVAARGLGRAGPDQPFHPAGFIGSLIGALVLIFLAIHVLHMHF